MNYFPTQAEMLGLVWPSLLGTLEIFTWEIYAQRFKQHGLLQAPTTQTQ